MKARELRCNDRNFNFCFHVLFIYLFIFLLFVMLHSVKLEIRGVFSGHVRPNLMFELEVTGIEAASNE